MFACVHRVDLAIAGAIRRDPVRVVAHGAAAVDHALQTGSGVVTRKLLGLRPYLAGMPADRHVRHLDASITQLAAAMP